MKKKVCMVVPSFSAKGGITSVVSGYKSSQLVHDYDVRFIESYCDGSKAKKILHAICAYAKYMWIVVFWKPQIVHVHSSFGASFFRKIPFITIANRYKIPIINHIHGADFEEFYWKASEKKKKKIAHVYNLCTKIIALSDEWKDKLKCIINADKINVIENYGIINENAIKARKNKKNTHTILFLGFLCKRKGCYDIPKVLEIVKQKIPDVCFVLAGSGEKEEISRIIKDNSIENIRFPGWIRGDVKHKYLTNCDLFFLPSYNEGMPMSILDAMGYGIPIISTNVGGISKIVHNDENGYIFKPGDVEGMAKAICELLINNEKRYTMGVNSAKIVIEGYSLSNHCRKIEKIYAECIAVD